MQTAQGFCVTGHVNMLISCLPTLIPLTTYPTYVPRDSRREQKVIVKYADHWRIRNERHVLLRFQSRTSRTCIRPLLDEVEEDGPNNLAFFLQHLDEVSWHTLDYRQLTRSEVKHIGKGVLERWKMKISRLRF